MEAISDFWYYVTIYMTFLLVLKLVIISRKGAGNMPLVCYYIKRVCQSSPKEIGKRNFNLFVSSSISKFHLSGHKSYAIRIRPK